MAASQADSDWVSLAGDAVDTAEALVNRSRAMSFMAAAALVLSALMQRLRERQLELNNAQLMRVLLQAHHQLTAAPESFAALMGHLSGGNTTHPALQVRIKSPRAYLLVALRRPTHLRPYGSFLKGDGAAAGPAGGRCGAQVLG